MGVKSVILVFFKSTTQIFADEPFFGFIFFDSNKYRIFVAEMTIERN